MGNRHGFGGWGQVVDHDLCRVGFWSANYRMGGELAVRGPVKALRRSFIDQRHCIAMWNVSRLGFNNLQV